ncbi:hypothetical protein [Limisalsivibrio acetivorans]|uniref:hypothetical protein n=1 Tax=Limisalsivibrio acetivorans TaxID=1304888 RepID=UPI0003B47F56|nr:hypothetical protein [Limisalsivibrio acetivorans]
MKNSDSVKNTKNTMENDISTFCAVEGFIKYDAAYDIAVKQAHIESRKTCAGAARR